MKDDSMKWLVDWTNQQVQNLIPMSEKDLREIRTSLIVEADLIADDPNLDGQLEMKIMLTLGLISYRLAALEQRSLPTAQPITDVPSVFKDLF